MEKVYIVCWASAGQDDDGNSTAHGGVHSVHLTPEGAKKGLEECKQEFYDEIVNNPDFDEDTVRDMKETTQVYGSIVENVDSCYFEIDYSSWDIGNEIYMCIETKEVTR